MNTAVFVFVFSCFVLKSEKKSIECMAPKRARQKRILSFSRGREPIPASRGGGKFAAPGKAVTSSRKVAYLVIVNRRVSNATCRPRVSRVPTYPREERVHDRPTFRQHKVQMSSRIQSTFCVFGVFCVVVRAVGVGREQPLQ